MGVLRFDLSDGPLRAEHERLLRTVLRRGAAAPERQPDEQIDIASLDPTTVRAARRVWRQRMVNEHQSATVFSRLLPQLIEAEASLDTKTSVLRMSMDELRHGALCADVVTALGGTPTMEMNLESQPLPEHPGCTPLERVLRNAMFVGCLAETVAVAFTAEERELTTDPFVRRVIGQISADEVLHARFGWAFAKEAVPELDDAARTRTHRWLSVAFAFLEQESMREVPSAFPPGELVAQGQSVGLCHNPETRRLFYETVADAIVPGLEALGLHAQRAWDRRHFAARQPGDDVTC
ncbi:MAG: hypothetical protein AAGF12_03005 [Myxococcota bacterium]